MIFKRINLCMLGVLFLLLSGCATVNEKISSSLNADETTQVFFRSLQRNDRQTAYSLLGKGLSQTITFSQFDQLMDTLEEQWGKIEDQNTAIMPFHQRIGERDFIPLNTPEENIKRYIFEVKFEHAEINFDLTIVNDGTQYKIVWFSLWGSSNYMKPEINEKIQELFSKPSTSDS